MKMMTEKSIIELIKSHSKWKGAPDTKRRDWKGMQNGKRVVRETHQGANS